MCGITGIYSQNGMAPGTLADAVGAMTRALTHRGTDDMGFFFSEDGNTGLGHTRLSIIDLIRLTERRLARIRDPEAQLGFQF